MKRRTLDVLFSLGGLALAGLLLVAGIVLTANANFANNYVRDQLTQQNITFKTADTLTDEEKAQPCLVENAGKQLTTGKTGRVLRQQLHRPAPGVHRRRQDLRRTRHPQSALRAQVAEAQKTGAANLADLQKQLADVTSQRETVFKGETLRGLLLTSYGFSEFGTKAGQAATVAYAAAGLMLLLALAGLIHAYVTPKTTTFAAPEPKRAKDLVNATTSLLRLTIGPHASGLPDRHFHVSTLHRISWSPRP